MHSLVIATAQINFIVGDIEGNASRIIKTVQQITRENPVDLIIFSELCLTGYPPEDLLYRKKLYTLCNEAIERIKTETKHTRLIIGYPALEGEERFNCAALIEYGECTHTYKKQQLPNYTVFDEKRYFTAGRSPCVFMINTIPIGLLICEDLWHDEPIDQAIQNGAKMIININASPFDTNKAESRRELLHRQASRHSCPIVYANQVGGQDELVFDGGSQITDSNGDLCQIAKYFQEDILITKITQTNKALSIKKVAPPAERNKLAHIYNALVLGVKDYVTKNHFKGVLLGLSGGIDSALTLAIAVDALGPDKVQAVLMPSQYTANISNEDAILEAKTLGVKYHILPIHSVAECFSNSLQETFQGLSVDKTEENIQARIRGTLIMALSNKFGDIVLTTGNKSEMAVGYATLYGDMAGGFAVLKDVPKTMVYQLSRYRNTCSPVIPDRVITREPSAELAPNQVDQDSLPPYDILDEIIYRFVDMDQSPETIIAAGFNKETVTRVIKLILINEYKRRQAPIGIRLSRKAFGKDRRYPITSNYLNNILK